MSKRAGQTRLDRDVAFVVGDTREKCAGMVSSWNYEADGRFADYTGDTEAVELCDKIAASSAPGPIIISAHDWGLRKIHARRIRALREAVRRGLLHAWWSGFVLYGVLTRTRQYCTPEYWRTINRDKTEAI